MTYPLINGTEINGAEGGESGHTSTAHGLPNAVAVLHVQGHLTTHHATPSAQLGYDMILRPSGALGTHHGNAMLVYTPGIVGATVLQAASSGVVTRHGTATVTSTRTLQAVGAAPNTQHGTPSARVVLHAHGHLASQHGTPSAVCALRLVGHCGTAHGAQRVTSVLRAAGHSGTRHGVPSAKEAAAIIVAHGHGGTQHGTPRVGVMTLRALSTPPSSRHGRALVNLGATC